MPGFHNIEYDAWSTQCKHGFESHQITIVNDSGLKLVAIADKRIFISTDLQVSFNMNCHLAKFQSGHNCALASLI